MKTCGKCGKEKTINDFYWKNKSKGIRASWCKVCMSEYHKKYYSDDIEYFRECSKQYYIDNKERHNEFMKEWRENNKGYFLKYQQEHRDQVNKNSNKYKKKNRDKCRKYNKQYKRNNRSKQNALEANRRVNKLKQTPVYFDKDKICFLYETASALTKERGIEYQVDHIKPLSKGGLHYEDNLQILSKHLNAKKSDKWPLNAKEKLLYTGITLNDLMGSK